MMNNSKILTVSYGTFSCTLEGFDDSFGTMKAIAEYFRDLAADDRYFGAEPPQPDAEMLARIAEKEVARKVQAREHEGKIVLSAVEDQKVDTPDAAEEHASALAVGAPVQADDASADDASAHATLEDAAPAEEADVIQATEMPVDIDVLSQPEPSAHPLVEASVQDAPTEKVPQTETDDTEIVDTIPVQTDVPTDLQAIEEDEIDIVPGQPDADVEAFFADATQEHLANEIEFEDATGPQSFAARASASPAGESIAEKLQRIRAVVSKTQAESTPDDFLEDEHAGTAIRSVDVLDAALEDIQDALEEDDANEAQVAATAEDAAQEDEVAEVLARLEQVDPIGEDDPADTLLSESAEDVNTAEDPEDRLKNLFEDEEDEAFEKTAAPKNITTTADLRMEIAPADASDKGDHAAPRARVVKVKRADLDAAIERGDLEEFGTGEEADPEQEQSPLDRLAPSKTDQTSLSPDQEDELARELAALEADIDADLDAPAETATPAKQPAASARGALPAIDDDSDADMNRLLAEADHKMDEPESATRREAFSHLRAAVAAKKADVAMGGSADDTKSDDAYRTDLAQVVRPRRPEGSSSKTPRPSENRPAPLKLVAEQRVDAGRPHTEGPVRPRRVAALKDTADTDPGDSSFADYAQEMGADTLPQLLEAAASYMSFVEGRDQFSRPQLMTKVRQAGAEDGFSREDGLRSFGQLLRSGKIEKIKGGRFTVSDDIGFRPDQRAAS